MAGYLGLRSQARFSPGYNILGLQPSESAYDLSHVSKAFDEVPDEETKGKQHAKHVRSVSPTYPPTKVPRQGDLRLIVGWSTQEV